MVLPPLWPSAAAGSPGKESGPGGTASHMFQFAPVLEEEDRVQREMLRRRTRGLARALIVSLVLTAASVAWVVQSRATRQEGMPPFVLLDSVRSPEQPAPLPAPLAAQEDSLSVRQPPLARLDSVPALPPPRRPSTDSRRQLPPALDLARRSRTDPRPPVDAPPGTPAAESAPPPAPVPAPPPAPNPAPPPASDRAPPTESPRPDRSPAEERELVALTVAEAVDRLVAAISSRNLRELNTMLIEDPGGATGRRERFLQLIQEYGPRATLDNIEEAIVGEDRARARFTVSLEWRGVFGAGQRKTGRFVGIVRRGGAGWRFEGSALLNDLP